MATLFDIDYEAGTLGNPVGAESGWDVGSISGTNEYTNVFTADGALGVKCTTQGIMRKAVTATNKWRERFYFSLPVIAPGANALLAQARNGTTQVSALRLESAGTLRLLNVGTATGSSSASLTADEPVRAEWWCDGTAGTCGCDLFRGPNVHGSTPDQQLAGTYTDAQATNLTASFPVSIASFVAYFDATKATDTPATPIGPVGASATATPGVVAVAATVPAPGVALGVVVAAPAVAAMSSVLLPARAGVVPGSAIGVSLDYLIFTWLGARAAGTTVADREHAYYAALSGLPANRSTADHKRAYLLTQTALPVAAGMTELELAYWAQVDPANVIGSYQDRARRFYGG